VWRNGSELTEREIKKKSFFSDFWGGFWWESGVQILDGRSRKLLVSCSLFLWGGMDRKSLFDLEDELGGGGIRLGRFDFWTGSEVLDRFGVELQFEVPIGSGPVSF